MTPELIGILSQTPVPGLFVLAFFYLKRENEKSEKSRTTLWLDAFESYQKNSNLALAKIAKEVSILSQQVAENTAMILAFKGKDPEVLEKTIEQIRKKLLSDDS